MAGDFLVKLHGLDEVRAALKALPHKLRKRVLRNALAVGARVFRDEARRLTPVMSSRTPQDRHKLAKGIRTPGTVRKAIRVRTSKRARAAGNVGVYVNVVPAKGAAKGANKPGDPYYWRWLEFGAYGKPGYQMLQRAVGRSSEALNKIIATLGPAIQKMNTKGGTR